LFLKKYDGSKGRVYKSKQDYEQIYWKGIGQARHRLKEGEHKNHETDEGVAEHRPSKGLVGRRKRMPVMRMARRNTTPRFPMQRRLNEEHKDECLQTNGRVLPPARYSRYGICTLHQTIPIDLQRQTYASERTCAQNS